MPVACYTVVFFFNFQCSGDNYVYCTDILLYLTRHILSSIRLCYLAAAVFYESSCGFRSSFQ